MCLPRGAVPCLRPHQGGRLREGGTRACLVVSPALAHGCYGGVLVVAVFVIVVRARDRNPNGPRPALAGLGSAGPSDRQPFRVISVPRGLEPGRGPLGPRGASPVPNESTKRRLRHIGLQVASAARRTTTTLLARHCFRLYYLDPGRLGVVYEKCKSCTFTRLVLRQRTIWRRGRALRS